MLATVRSLRSIHRRLIYRLELCRTLPSGHLQASNEPEKRPSPQVRRERKNMTITSTQAHQPPNNIQHSLGAACCPLRVRNFLSPPSCNEERPVALDSPNIL
ncbi:hypothetical protein KSP39_PZI013601 [Platanthera zijinensis]|uniref:Uncharacterized protein n=1 Tax=Platanthera zijinensis TaxID=2320716 RepID=A0AAP0G3F3_9ASPA